VVEDRKTDPGKGFENFFFK